jgi:O-acetyl-ADP-ribose deacetylase (regulator of RNase III)
MKIAKGEICNLALAGQYNMIVHGVNCQGKMGAGVAARIASVFPEAYADYRKACKRHPDPGSLLGRISYCSVCLHAEEEERRLYIVNAFTQLDYRGEGVRVSYAAVETVFRRIRSIITGSESRIRIAYPRIGAGLGGGDWEVIAPIIDEQLDGCDHTLVEYDGS